MKIAFFPHKGNKYIEIMQKAVRLLGHSTAPFREAWRRDCKAVSLNWYESFRSRRRKHEKFLLAIAKCLIVLYFNAAGKKVIFVMHNKQSHERRSASVWLQGFLLRRCDAIQVLSTPSLRLLPERMRKKAFYVPHPNYIGEYPLSLKYSRESLMIPRGKLVYLFAGLVRPYKNVELLIDAAKNLGGYAHFIIAGAPHSAAYRDELLRRIEGCGNITALFRFIPDDELTSLIGLSDALALPYDVSSALNSGTVFLAFSNKRTVIAPMIASLEDIKDKSCFIGYTYKDETEHKRILQEKLTLPLPSNSGGGRIDAAQIRERLHEMGRRAYDYVREHNSLEAVSAQYKIMLDALFQEKDAQRG